MYISIVGEGPFGQRADDFVDGEIASGTCGLVIVNHSVGKHPAAGDIKTSHEDVCKLGCGKLLGWGGSGVFEISDEANGDGVRSVAGVGQVRRVNLCVPARGDLDDAVGGGAAVADDEMIFDSIGVAECLSVVSIEGGGAT